MTASQVAELGLAFGVTLFLIALSWFMGAFRSVKIDEALARERISFDEPDFTIDSLLLGGDGNAAVALNERAREGVLVFALGDSLATRRFRIGALGAESAGAILSVTLGEISKGRVDIAAHSPAVAAEWARRVAGARLES